MRRRYVSALAAIALALALVLAPSAAAGSITYWLFCPPNVGAYAVFHMDAGTSAFMTATTAGPNGYHAVAGPTKVQDCPLSTARNSPPGCSGLATKGAPTSPGNYVQSIVMTSTGGIEKLYGGCNL